VPTFVEQGYKDLIFSEWFGFFAPGGTPSPVTARANGALAKALAQKDVIDGVAVMGLEAKSSSAQELATEDELRPLGADCEEDWVYGGFVIEVVPAGIHVTKIAPTSCLPMLQVLRLRAAPASNSKATLSRRSLPIFSAMRPVPDCPPGR